MSLKKFDILSLVLPFSLLSAMLLSNRKVQRKAGIIRVRRWAIRKTVKTKTVPFAFFVQGRDLEDYSSSRRIYAIKTFLNSKMAA